MGVLGLRCSGNTLAGEPFGGNGCSQHVASAAASIWSPELSSSSSRAARLF